MHIISFQHKKRFIYFFLLLCCACSNFAMPMLIHTPFSGFELFDLGKVSMNEFHVRKKNGPKREIIPGRRNKFKFYLHRCTYCTNFTLSWCWIVNWVFVKRKIKKLEQWVSSELRNDLHIIFNDHHQCQFYYDCINQAYDDQRIITKKISVIFFILKEFIFDTFYLLEVFFYSKMLSFLISVKWMYFMNFSYELQFVRTQ